MERLNLGAAIILIIFGTAFLVISVNPVTLTCLLTSDACYTFYLQSIRDWFIAYFTMGATSMAVAILFLYLGRSREEDDETILSLKIAKKPATADS
jgi:hypothetical protein